MKLIVGMIMVAALAVSSGCAKTDWIDRTLVTANVTGVWEGSFRGTGGGGGGVTFVLQQQGAKVTGGMKIVAGGRQLGASSEEGIPIEGTVSGDTFIFHGMAGPQMRGEFQVNVDEMIGAWTRVVTQTATLRRRE
jgi:hypothetical protein